MAFNPLLPVDASPESAAEMRNQFNGLNDLIAACPTTSDMVDYVADNSAGPCAGLNPLNLTVSDPPTQAQMQTLATRLDDLLVALKRM